MEASAVQIPPTQALQSAEATIEAVFLGVDGALSKASDERAFVAALDRLLEAGIALKFAQVAHAMLELPLEEILRAIEALRRDLGKLSQETRGLVLEALGVQEQVQPVVDRLAREARPNVMVDATEARVRAPLGYLVEFPVEVASLLLAQDRGALAAVATLRWMERSAPVEPSPLFLAARTWRDGMRASARLLASVRPDLVSEGLVPAVERIDIAALVERRRAQDAWLAELVAAHPDDDSFPVYPDAAAHDAP